MQSWERTPTDLSPAQVTVGGMHVDAGEKFYFVLSNGERSDIAELDGGTVPLDEVHFAPHLRYTACSGTCGGRETIMRHLGLPSGQGTTEVLGRFSRTLARTWRTERPPLTPDVTPDSLG